MKSTHLVLFDTASLYFRAFFALPDSLRSPEGRLVNAVHGLTDYLARFIESTGATHAACCWDNDWRPGWRVRLLPSYKSHRLANPADADIIPPAIDVTSLRADLGALDLDGSEESPDDLSAQIPAIVTMLAAAGIAIVGANHCEADDVIGSLAAQAPMPVSIVTGDRDLFQLVDDERRVEVIYTGRGLKNAVPCTACDVVDKYGVQPHQYADFAVLRGDASDGLPGVAGIGDKTAAALLQRYGTLSALLTAVEAHDTDVPARVRQALHAARPYIAAAVEVVNVRRDLALSFDYSKLKLSPAPSDWLVSAAKLGLRGPATRLEKALAATTTHSCSSPTAGEEFTSDTV